MAKTLTNQHLAVSDPGTDAELVDISSADHAFTHPVLLLVGGAGDIKVETSAGTTITIPSVPVGYLLCFVTKVYKTGTAATFMTAIF